MTTPTENLPIFLRRATRDCDQCPIDPVTGERPSCQACNGTGLIADGRLEAVMHVTWLEDWATCEEKFHLAYGEAVEPSSPKIELNFGKAIHSALSHRYRWEMENGSSDVPLDVLEEGQRDIIEKHFEANPVGPDEWQNQGRAMELIQAYNAFFPRHDWLVVGVEERFEVLVGEVPMLEGEIGPGEIEMPPTIPCYLAGRKDLVVAWHDGIWIVDFKTTKDWNSDLDSNRNLLMGRASFQFKGYPWAEAAMVDSISVADGMQHPERVTLPVKGTIGTWLCARAPLLRAPIAGRTSKAREEFYQECFGISADQRDEWRSDFLLKCRRVLAAWSSGEWERGYGKACGGFGRCPYFDYCHAEPKDRPSVMQALFREKDFSYLEE